MKKIGKNYNQVRKSFIMKMKKTTRDTETAKNNIRIAQKRSLPRQELAMVIMGNQSQIVKLEMEKSKWIKKLRIIRNLRQIKVYPQNKLYK